MRRFDAVVVDRGGRLVEVVRAGAGVTVDWRWTGLIERALVRHWRWTAGLEIRSRRVGGASIVRRRRRSRSSSIVRIRSRSCTIVRGALFRWATMRQYIASGGNSGVW